jgi:hypothetical protein
MQPTTLENKCQIKQEIYINSFKYNYSMVFFLFIPRAHLKVVLVQAAFYEQ